MATTSNSKSKKTSKPRVHSNAKRAKSKPKISAVGNPCDDQNGMLLCWGGQQTNVPFPTSGGPWMPIVAYNSTTGLMELQYADLSTMCPGTALAAPAPCRECGCAGETPDDAPGDADTELHSPVPTEPDQL